MFARLHNHFPLSVLFSTLDDKYYDKTIELMFSCAKFNVSGRLRFILVWAIRLQENSTNILKASQCLLAKIVQSFDSHFSLVFFQRAKFYILARKMWHNAQCYFQWVTWQNTWLLALGQIFSKGEWWDYCIRLAKWLFHVYCFHTYKFIVKIMFHWSHSILELCSGYSAVKFQSATFQW